MGIGEELAKVRVQRNVTQKQIADHFRVSHSMISMVETGELECPEGLATLIRNWIKSGGGVTISAPRGARGNYSK